MTIFNPEPLRILAVDDEPLILNLYQTILSPKNQNFRIAEEMEALEDQIIWGKELNARSFSCDLVICRQGPQAVEIVKKALAHNQPFAVVFLDILMPPGPDGIWTAEQIR